MPLSLRSLDLFLNPGKCSMEQVGVKAPGTPIFDRFTEDGQMDLFVREVLSFFHMIIHMSSDTATDIIQHTHNSRHRQHNITLTH